MSRTQDIVTKINILLQDICDIKLQKQRNNIINDHKIHPKGTDGENDQDDTHLIHNSTLTHPPHDRQNTPEHHAPNPNHAPNTDGNAFVQQKPDPYELWSASPPESLSSSSSDKDSTDGNVDCTGYALMKTGLPQKRVGRGEGEREMRSRMEEECPGPSSSAVTKPSGPEPDSEAGHH